MEVILLKSSKFMPLIFLLWTEKQFVFFPYAFILSGAMIIRAQQNNTNAVSLKEHAASKLWDQTNRYNLTDFCISGTLKLYYWVMSSGTEK